MGIRIVDILLVSGFTGGQGRTAPDERGDTLQGE